MPVFLCRWQNGDFSVVKAKDKDEAIYFLDEVAEAGPEDVTALTDFMVHFHLATDGKAVPDGLDDLIELEGFGERTTDHIMRLGYPVLNKAIEDAARDEDGTPTEEGLRTIRQAVDKEKSRLWPQGTEEPGAEPKTPLGGRIRAVTDAPSKMIDKGKGKPN